MYCPASSRSVFRVVGLLVLPILALATACGAPPPEEPKPRPLPEDAQTLSPGTYRSEEFQPSFSFRVGKGWSSTPWGASDVLEITRGQTAGLSFVNVQEVYKPTRTGEPNVVDAPEDLVGWLQQHPYLRTSEPEPVTVGGVEGVQFDVVLGDLPQNYIPTCTSIVGTPNCVDLFRLSTGGPILVLEGDKVGGIVLEDVGGETVAIGVYSPASEFGEHAPEAQKVIDSVEWTGS